MPRPQDWIGRHAQPRRRTAAGTRTGGGAFQTHAQGRTGTSVGVVGVSLVGSCVCGPPGWGVVGQSEVGLGDTLVPVAADRVKYAYVGYSYCNRAYEVS